MSNAKDILLRTKSGTGDDTDWAGTNTVPGASDLGGMPGYTPPGQDTIHRLEVAVVPVDSSGDPVNRSGTVDLTLVKVIRRSVRDDGAGSDEATVVDTATITGAAFNALQDVPFAGGEYSVRLTNITGAPGTATAFEVWVRNTVR